MPRSEPPRREASPLTGLLALIATLLSALRWLNPIACLRAREVLRLIRRIETLFVLWQHGRLLRPAAPTPSAAIAPAPPRPPAIRRRTSRPRTTRGRRAPAPRPIATPPARIRLRASLGRRRKRRRLIACSTAHIARQHGSLFCAPLPNGGRTPYSFRLLTYNQHTRAHLISQRNSPETPVDPDYFAFA